MAQEARPTSLGRGTAVGWVRRRITRVAALAARIEVRNPADRGTWSPCASQCALWPIESSGVVEKTPAIRFLRKRLASLAVLGGE